MNEEAHGGRRLLPRLLELARSAATGMLALRTPSRTLTVLVRAGRVLHVESGDPGATVSVLAAAGLLPAAEAPAARPENTGHPV